MLHLKTLVLLRWCLRWIEPVQARAVLAQLSHRAYLEGRRAGRIREAPLTEALAGLQQELEPNAEIFTVQVSSFPTVEEAGAFAKQLERKGFEPYVTAAEIPGRGTWHRVRVGNYRSIDGAETLRDRLASVDIAGLVLKARSR